MSEEENVTVEGTPSDDNATTTTEETTEAKESTDEGMLDGEKEGGGLLEGEPEGEGEPESEKTEVPEAYEAFTVTDGYQLTEAQHGEFSAVAKDLGLSQTQAQKLVAFDNERVVAQQKVYAEQDAADRETIKKKYGDGFKAADVIANKAFKTFFESKDHREALTNSGATADPAFFDAMVKLGKAIGEDSFVKGGGKVKSIGDRTLADSLQDPD